MGSRILEKDFRDLVTFHGHVCLDIALGYRVAKAAMRALACERPSDEELVAVVENDSCSVDAIQTITGCTFGKGNLIYRPFGKAVYTVYDRRTERAVRLYCHFWQDFDTGEGREFMGLMNRALSGEGTLEDRERFQTTMRETSHRILDMPEDRLFTLTAVSGPPPPPARIFASAACDRCGEWTMQIRLAPRGGQRLCQPCRDAIA